jgi:hypothetical protein
MHSRLLSITSVCRKDVYFLTMHSPLEDVHGERVAVLGTTERKQLIAWLASELPEATGEPRFWPGHGLMLPPPLTAIMPYHPYGT